MARVAEARKEVSSRILEHRCPVVVGAEHEHTGHTTQWPEGSCQRPNRILVRDVVAGVDDKIGFEIRETAQPIEFFALARYEMNVRKVEHRHRPGAGRQYGNLCAAKAERAHLIPGRVGESGDTERGHEKRQATGEAHSGKAVICVTGS